MRYHNISDIFEMIEKMQRKFEQSLAGLTPDQENFRPSPDRWTIAENAEHVTIVNGGFVRLTNKMLKQAEAESRPALSDLQMPPLTLTDEGEMKPGKWQAPDMVKPKGGIGVELSVAGNRQIIDELFALKSESMPSISRIRNGIIHCSETSTSTSGWSFSANTKNVTVCRLTRSRRRQDSLDKTGR
ncbi:MAG: DinB family protein [Acidobacteria bacterium]|nr:DinB family protein [Acidobacteriota bacterium]